jgi:hypothetical protein
MNCDRIRCSELNHYVRANLRLGKTAAKTVGERRRSAAGTEQIRTAQNPPGWAPAVSEEGEGIHQSLSTMPGRRARWVAEPR